MSARYQEGFEIAQRGVARREVPDGLFVELWIYEYGLLDELAVNAYWVGAYRDCLDACELILSERNFPTGERDRIEANAEFARQKLASGGGAASSPGGARAAGTVKKLKIVIYTIALNEAHHVERWCNSAKDADLLVVADTGSTDDTAERLSAAGVQVHRIAIRPWRFDDARNACLALLPADADVCISLDMDEFMLPGWRQAVESAWTPGTTRLFHNFAPNYDGLEASTLTMQKSKIHARWGYRWKRIVHEDLHPTDPHKKHSMIDTLLVGQIQDLTKNRSNYLPMLEQAHGEDPNDSQVCFWLARDLMYTGLHERSAGRFKAYLDIPTSTWPDERSEAMRYLARVEPERKREWLQKAIAEAPYRRELWLDLSEFFHAEQNWLDLFWACVSGIEKTRRTGSYLDEPVAWGYRLYDLAALACSHLGLIDQAIMWGATALDFIPNDPRLTNNLAYYRSQASTGPQKVGDVVQRERGELVPVRADSDRG
jgi:glycosyltransferase involved in cell wall biosynthesis